MKIHGKLSLTVSDWRLIYSSIINYLNLRIRKANKYANEIYLSHSKKSIQETRAEIERLYKETCITSEEKHLIESSLFVGSSSKIYKPKQKNFELLSNRTEYVNFGSIIVFFEKSTNSIRIETSQFDNFDDYVRDEPFIQEFITMVNTIDWPERTGPSITIRGCTLIKLSDNKSTVFYKVGSNPPKLFSDNDETTEEPQILQSNVFKDISLVSTEDDSEQLVAEDKVDYDL
jgi:hypothetical protein